ncbi:MAG: AraC family transcriptional regulator [Geminicoccaceae bacterium]
MPFQSPPSAGRGPGSAWQLTPIRHIEDLSDAVLGAGLEAVQMSRLPVTGSLVFALHDGVVCSSGHIGGRVAFTGPLSADMITFGLGLTVPPGTRHWLGEVATGDFGVFLPGDDHDALYMPGALYATVTLTAGRLEAAAERFGFVLDTRMLGGTGFHARRVPEGGLVGLRAGFARVHAGRPARWARAEVLGGGLLDAAITHFGRLPRPVIGRLDPRGHARIVARARAYVQENLDAPLSVDAMAAAAFTSPSHLHRAFVAMLDETPQSYVRKLRLHRIRRDLASGAEIACTVAIAANRWGIGELGRLSGWYRELFGELPSRTLAQSRRRFDIAA